tara:strand:+ start:339 stop:785 length:447 start_codon:yes stop_codon:yes gene_type:complete
MEEKKYPIKRRISIHIGFGVVILIFLGIWLWIRGQEGANILIFITNLILPYFIGIGFLFILIQFFVLDRLYYIKLTEDSMIIYSVFPVKTYKYSEIKRISFNNGWLKGVDTGSYLPWITFMKLVNPDQFLSDLKKRNKNIIIEEKFLK